MLCFIKVGATLLDTLIATQSKRPRLASAAFSCPEPQFLLSACVPVNSCTAPETPQNDNPPTRGLPSVRVWPRPAVLSSTVARAVDDRRSWGFRAPHRWECSTVSGEALRDLVPRRPVPEGPHGFSCMAPKSNGLESVAVSSIHWSTRKCASRPPALTSAAPQDVNRDRAQFLRNTRFRSVSRIRCLDIVWRASGMLCLLASLSAPNTDHTEPSRGPQTNPEAPFLKIISFHVFIISVSYYFSETVIEHLRQKMDVAGCVFKSTPSSRRQQRRRDRSSGR